jgi:hypothetical protein
MVNSILYGFVLMIFVACACQCLGVSSGLYSLISLCLGVMIGFLPAPNPTPPFFAIIFGLVGTYLGAIGCMILIWMGVAPKILYQSHALEAALMLPMPAGFIAGFAQKNIERIVKLVVEICIA